VEVQDLNLSDLAPNLKVDNIVKTQPRIRCDSRTYYQNYLYYLGSIGKQFDITSGLKMKGGHVFLDYFVSEDGFESHRIVIYSDFSDHINPLVNEDSYNNYGKLTAYENDKKSLRLELLVNGGAYKTSVYKSH